MSARIATAAVGIPVFLAAVWAGGWWFAGVIALLAGIGYWEYARLWRARGIDAAAALGVPAAAGLVLAAHGWPGSGPGLLLTAATLAFLARAVLRFHPDSAREALLGVAGVGYVGGLFAHFVLLRDREPGGLWLVVFGLAVTWAADSVAYFAGLAWGRRRLAPALSPGKSVEGAVAGLVAGVAAGALLGGVAGLRAGWIGAALGAVLALGGMVGDLAESAIKRHAGVKDSGGLLPGHGGVLDRFDAALFTVPLLYYASLLLGVGR